LAEDKKYVWSSCPRKSAPIFYAIILKRKFTKRHLIKKGKKDEKDTIWHK
jgi:hypothetical protein